VDSGRLARLQRRDEIEIVAEDVVLLTALLLDRCCTARIGARFAIERRLLKSQQRADRR